MMRRIFIFIHIVLLCFNQNNNIIELNLKPITEYDLDGVEPTFHLIGDLSNVMREDVVKAPFPREVALSNSSSVKDGCFMIPSILGGEGDR